MPKLDSNLSEWQACNGDFNGEFTNDRLRAVENRKAFFNALCTDDTYGQESLNALSLSVIYCSSFIWSLGLRQS